MEKTYKIANGQVKNVADRSLRILFILAVFAPLIGLVPAVTEGEIVSSVIACLLTYALMGYIFYNSRSLSITIYQNMIFRVSDNFFSREVSIDSSKLSFYQKFMWESNKAAWNKLISLSDIDSIKDQKHSLLIKCKGVSRSAGGGMVILPKEVEGYEELEKILRQKTNIF
jgi:hypothetical protein